MNLKWSQQRIKAKHQLLCFETPCLDAIHKMNTQKVYWPAKITMPAKR